MATVLLSKFVIHATNPPQSTLKRGNVEAVFTVDDRGGQGINWVSVDALNEWLDAAMPSNYVESHQWSLMLAFRNFDPTFQDSANVLNRTMNVNFAAVPAP
jgi:hypothetical protein